MYPYDSPIKQKSFLCAHGGMKQLGLNYLETYSPVVKWISVRDMLTLVILRYLHTNYVDFVLVYTQVDVKSEIFMEFIIVFGIEGSHQRECSTRLDKNFFGMKYSGLA